MALVLSLALLAPGARAAPPPDFSLVGASLQQRANNVLALMSYSVVPDLASSSLAIDDVPSGNPSLVMTQLAGGFTFSRTTPLYLEGGIAASRYDPQLTATNGIEQRVIPVRWNSLALTGGVGWDFPVAADLKFRPIFNFSLGRVASDLTVAQEFLEQNLDMDFDFLDNGHLDAYGLGASVMLDYELVRPDDEIDVELRYSAIRLRSFGNSASTVRGQADAIAASLWSRYRAPTGWTVLDRPVRHVLEYAFTRYLGDQAGILGFDHLHSLGVGLELDSSAHEIFVTRTRLVGRYMFGTDVEGFSVGLAVSF